jgi:hypothetical protein
MKHLQLAGDGNRKKSILKVSPVKLKLKSTNPLPHHTKEIFPKISYKRWDFDYRIDRLSIYNM